jgi:hypothetical protein
LIHPDKFKHEHGDEVGPDHLERLRQNKADTIGI